ncbi:MAG: hypothetical protein ACSHX0_05840 [Akkermansiaceae bacterium]
MAKLILHVGPGKCGSSTVQQFFATQKKPCVQSTRYNLMDLSEIKALNCEEPNKLVLTSFTKQLSKNLSGCDTLILSQESLFQCPRAIKNICFLAKNKASEISIIGYSRRQSDFLISAYSQWFFRSLERVNEVVNILDELELDVAVFTGLERQLIASIANDFYSARQLSGYSILNWHNSYNNILQLTHESGALIKCGVLPNKESDITLIQDFCEKSELTLRHTTDNSTRKISNVSFNQDVIEAINNAVTLGLEVGPHESNDVIELLSSKMSPVTKCSSEFLSKLKSYIDTYYLDSNIQLCKQFGLNETYFAPSDSPKKSEILDIIVHEGHQRSLNKSTIIRNHKILSARMIELCINQAKDI